MTANRWPNLPERPGRREESKSGKGRKGDAPHSGKGPGVRPRPRRGGKGRRKRFSGEIISPEPPYSAGRKAAELQSFSFDSRQGVLVVSGKAQFFCGISAAPFFSGKACARAVFLPGGQGAAGIAVLPPAAERPGVRRFGCNFRVSVYFVPAHAGRLRPGVAGPSCIGKGFQESRGALYRGMGFIPPPRKHNAFSTPCPVLFCGGMFLSCASFCFCLYKE